MKSVGDIFKINQLCVCPPNAITLLEFKANALQCFCHQLTAYKYAKCTAITDLEALTYVLHDNDITVSVW